MCQDGSAQFRYPKRREGLRCVREPECEGTKYRGPKYRENLIACSNQVVRGRTEIRYITLVNEGSVEARFTLRRCSTKQANKCKLDAFL
jgi:hypothetical protein